MMTETTMKQFNITLTESEIETLQICLCHVQLDIHTKIDSLWEHNKSGIHTRRIEQQCERVKDCEKLWHKLYDSTKDS